MGILAPRLKEPTKEEQFSALVIELEATATIGGAKELLRLCEEIDSIENYQRTVVTLKALPGDLVDELMRTPLARGIMG